MAARTSPSTSTATSPLTWGRGACPPTPRLVPARTPAAGPGSPTRPGCRARTPAAAAEADSGAAARPSPARGDHGRRGRGGPALPPVIRAPGPGGDPHGGIAAGHRVLGPRGRLPHPRPAAG